ncbi:MAG: hypothetical protein ROO76_09660 [Terriglobia bacterium]|jgi:hypothetical protein|nr:hypothetical protein [Terriglobia bacterium]
MRALNVKEISTDMLHDDSGTANFNWISIGMAILLFLVMTRLEGLIYCCTGGGFLLP